MTEPRGTRNVTKAAIRLIVSLGVIAIIVLGGLVHWSAAQDAKPKGALEKVFPNSNKCKRCHERVFEEWETSPLSKSIHSSTFRAALDEYMTFAGEAHSIKPV